jgi:nucleotide-binding universal stress UspA family protein
LIRCAADLAKQFDSRVLLLHIVQVPEPLLPSLVFNSKVVEAQLCENARMLLASLATELRGDIRVDEWVRTGCPADQLVAAAHWWRADLLIVGDHERKGVRRFLLGSTADAVIRRAPSPVLIVRAKLTARETGETSGSSNRSTVG